MVTIVKESNKMPPLGVAALAAARELPDGLGAIAGTGFTITGLTRADDGTWWAANEGQANEKDKSYTPSLVHLSSDMRTKIGEIALTDAGSANIQGLAYYKGQLFVGSTSDRLVKIFDSSTGALNKTIAPSSGTDVNGIAIDTTLDAVIIGHNSDSGGATVEWRSLTDGVLLKSVFLQATPDHLFFDASVGAEGALWYTYGGSGAGAIGRVVQFDVATGKNLQRFDLAAADSIEGIYVSGGNLWLANDAYYHHGQPALNRILQFQVGGAVNAAPTAVSLTNVVDSITENSPVGAGIRVADIIAIDDGLGSNSLSLRGSDAGSFAVRTSPNGVSSLFYIGGPADFESRSNYSIEVVATDNAMPGSGVSKLLSLGVTDVNEAPTGLALSAQVAMLSENVIISGGIKLADLLVADDALGANLLSLSGADAGNFAVREGPGHAYSLYYTGSSPDYESKNSYTISIDLSDPTLAANATLHQSFVLNVADIAEDVVGPTAGNDTIYGSNGADSLTGLSGDDCLFGLDSDDVLDGGTGNDILDGGSGKDYLLGGDGSDTARYASATASVKVDMGNPAKSSGDAFGDKFVSIENLTGSAFNDSLIGDNAANLIIGGDGNDSIAGQGGADTIIGGIGSDTIAGNGGNDRIVGGLGDDNLAGGASGRDWFVYDTQGWGNDKITDFEDGLDLLDFRGSDLSFKNLEIGQQGDDVLIRSPDHLSSILLQHTLSIQISQSDFLF